MSLISDTPLLPFPGDVIFEWPLSDIGTWQDAIVLHNMHKKTQMNLYEQFLVEKSKNSGEKCFGEKSVTDARKEKTKERSFPS